MTGDRAPAFSPMEEVLDALRAGRPVIVSDAADRENEGDAILSAALATPEWIAWMVRRTSGYLCAPLPGELADRLALPPMVVDNEDVRRTAYTITVDAASGVTTGISARDRARTLNVLADASSTPADLIRPGHVLPVRAVDGGVRERAGHTEAAVELMRAAGLPPVGVIGEMIADDGSTMRMHDLQLVAREERLPITTIELLIEWLDAREGRMGGARSATYAEADTASGPGAASASHGPRVQFEVETTVPTTHGPLRMRAYRDLLTGADHVAIVADPRDAPRASDARGAVTAAPGPILVRVHSECLTGEAFGSILNTHYYIT